MIFANYTSVITELFYSMPFLIIITIIVTIIFIIKL